MKMVKCLGVTLLFGVMCFSLPSAEGERRMKRSPSGYSINSCQCRAGEVLVGTECQPYPSGTWVKVRDSHDEYSSLKIALTDANVRVQSLNCNLEGDDRQITFERDHFYLRIRGDAVLLPLVGELQGHRISSFCIIHFLKDDGELSWRMDACLPPPVVPRCCPPGQALSQNSSSEHPSCQTAADTLEHLTPPISAGPDEPSISWPVIKNEVRPLTCPPEAMMMELELGSNPSFYLLNLPNDMRMTWSSLSPDQPHRKMYDPDMCVEGRQNEDNSVTYKARICYSNDDSRMDHHQRECKNNICVRKCCKTGRSLKGFVCTTTNGSDFVPPFENPPEDYKVITGYPICGPMIEAKKYKFTDEGELIAYNENFPSSRYCIDRMITGEINTSSWGAIVCVDQLSSVWDGVRYVLYPVCGTISIVFLCISVFCYLMVPALLHLGGWHQMCHALALIIAYCFSVLLSFISLESGSDVCVFMALATQFGYLAAFFWLSVLCFEVWRNIRGVVNAQASTVLSGWLVCLYAWGGPTLISTITAVIHYSVPYDSESIAHPHLGRTRCWFPHDYHKLFLYFYGPIAVLLTINIIFISLTFRQYRKLNDTAIMLTDVGDSTTTIPNAADDSEKKWTYIAEFKQQFGFLSIATFCWLAEIFSVFVPPPELWALSDVLNVLQGFFFFIFFITNKSKRQRVAKRFPRTFEAIERCCCFCFRRKRAKPNDEQTND